MCPACVNGDHDNHVRRRYGLTGPGVLCPCQGDCAPVTDEHRAALSRLTAAGVIGRPNCLVRRMD